MEPSPGDRIDGLIAAVPGADWEALDERETFYERVVAEDVSHPLPEPPAIQIYHAPVAMHPPAEGLQPIHLSYLDVVVQGFLAEFGTPGVARFFETTDGWEAPVLNDRAAPRYPRHQRLETGERDLVDQHLDAVGVQIIKT